MWVTIGLLCIVLAGPVQGRPSWATSEGNSCSSCHGVNLLTGKMQVSSTRVLTDLGTQLNGKVRGHLKTFRATPGDVVTLSVDVLDGYDKFAVQLKRLETGGQVNDQNNLLIWSEANSPDNIWTRQEVNNPPYFTYDNGQNGGISGSVTPDSYTFDLLIDANTPPDFYDLEFAVAGKADGVGLWYQDEHFYLEVLQPDKAALVAQILAAIDIIDTTGFHDMSEEIEAAQTMAEVSPRNLGKVQKALIVTLAVAWPKDLAGAAVLFEDSAQALVDALTSEDLAAAKTAAAEVHNTQHDLSHVVYEWLSAHPAETTN